MLWLKIFAICFVILYLLLCLISIKGTVCWKIGLVRLKNRIYFQRTFNPTNWDPQLGNILRAVVCLISRRYKLHWLVLVPPRPIPFGLVSIPLRTIFQIYN